MENYIKKNLLSIVIQSFKDFQIVVVNDNLNDKTVTIIECPQLDDSRIRFISHSKNLQVYRSMIEAILNNNSKYILLVDHDDTYMNDNILQTLFNYNNQNNFDIIVFTVYQQYDNFHKIFISDNQYETHFYEFSKIIIY